MGEAARILEEDKQVTIGTSCLIKKMLEAIRDTTSIKSIELKPEMTLSGHGHGMSMPLVNVGKGEIYVTLKDITTQRELPLKLKYDSQRRDSLIVGELMQLNRNQFCLEEVAREIRNKPPIVDLTKILQSYSMLKELEIDETLTNTRVHSAKRTGFFRLDYHQTQKYLTGVMIDKEHPYRGISFSGKVQNLHFGQILVNNLKGYRILQNR